MKHVGVLGLVLAIVSGLGPSAGAAEMLKHSGSIFSIGDSGTTFVLAEVGPWRVREGATVVTYRTISVTPQTEFAYVGRADWADTGFPGDFVELRLGPGDVSLDDYITVDCLHEGRRLIARKITVTDARP
jgi:hypothetical protein